MFWKQELMGCSRSFCQSERRLTLPLARRGGPRLHRPISWQRVGARFPQSAAPGRCSPPLFSVINISNAQETALSWHFASSKFDVRSLTYGSVLHAAAVLSHAMPVCANANASNQPVFDAASKWVSCQQTRLYSSEPRVICGSAL